MSDEIVNADDKSAEDKAQDTDNATDNSGKSIPKSRFDQVVAQKNELGAALDEIATELIEEIPEDLRDIIPDLPPAQKIKWLRAAKKKGVFGGNQSESGPDSKRPGNKKPTDFDGMSPQAVMATGYKKSK